MDQGCHFFVVVNDESTYIFKIFKFSFHLVAATRCKSFLDVVFNK
jgi:hypothetical protein